VSDEQNGGFKPRNKVEADIFNAGKLVAGIFGLKVEGEPVQEAMHQARTHVGSVKATDGKVYDYVECDTCHTHYDAAKDCPVCVPPEARAPKPKDGPKFYCAWDGEGSYRGAFVSPYQAHEAAGEDGMVKVKRAHELPED